VLSGVVKLRAAFVDAANGGEFLEWGITDGIQLQSLHYKAGVQGEWRLFVLNPERLAEEIQAIGHGAGL
jgi:hypothetical protein